MLSFSPASKAENASEISLPSVEKQQLLTGSTAQVFLPSKLILGQDNKFVIKGNPGSKVSLAISNSNHGAKPIMGINLRLGETEQTIESTIPATGVVELIYKVPSNEELLDKIKYVEVAIWSKVDFSDIAIAKSIGASGRETLNNGLAIVLPPESGKKPTFEPVIPGISGDLFKSIQAMKDVQEGKVNPELIDSSYYQKPTPNSPQINNHEVK